MTAINDSPISLPISSQSLDIQEQIAQFKEQVNAVFRQGNYPEALQMANEGLSQFIQQNIPRGQAVALQLLGMIYRQQRNIEGSLDVLQQAATLFESIDDKPGIAAAINGMGLTYNYVRDYPAALGCFQRSLAIAQALADDTLEANALGNISMIYSDVGDNAQSLEMLHRCLALFEARGDEHKVAITLMNIASNYVTLKDPKSIILFGERALAMLETIGDRYHMAGIINMLGAAYVQVEQIEFGLNYLYRGLEISESLEMPAFVAMCLSDIANTLAQAERFEEAKAYWERSLRINGKEDDKLRYVESLIGLGTLYANIHFAGWDGEAAILLLQEARGVAEELDDPRLLCPIYNLLADLYERQGDTKEALSWHRLMYQTEKRLFNEQSDERIRNLEVRFKVNEAQQTAEIAHLRTVELAEALREAERLRKLADERSEYNHKIAEILQQAVLPTLPERVAPQLAVRTFYQPASDEAAVGGDFYDVFPLGEGKTVLVVGDVIGHGLEAALSIAEVRFALRAFLSLNTSPDLGDALGQLNNFLVKNNEMRRAREGNGYRNRLVALTLIVINPSQQELHLVSAGMEPALLIRAGTRTVEYLDAGDMVLGVMPNIRYKAQHTCIHIADLLAVTTDGITEAFGEEGGQQFGKEGLGASLIAALPSGALPPRDLPQIGEATLSTVRAFVGSTLRDDVCLLLSHILSA